MLDATAEHALPPTEQRLAASQGLDELDSAGVLALLAEQDAVALSAVRARAPEIAALVDLAADRLRLGGAVHYFGAGTSGRLAVLDAVELVPTFHLEAGRIVAHLAGGDAALTRAVEGAEDSRVDGAADARGLGELDIAIGLTASGSTPYVGGALEAARAAGAHTVLVSSNPAAPLASVAAESLVLDTGPEVITGSTRLKAGTATKLMLNGFSTALMVAIGRTWSNLMVSVVATNAKLRARSARILRSVTTLDEAGAELALAACDGELTTAIVVTLRGVEPAAARTLLGDARGSVRHALEASAP